MRVRFIPEALRRPDDLEAEVVVATIWEDERPVRGLAGFIDWHLHGRLQEWVKRGVVTGQRGEAVLLAGRPQLTVEKVVLIGLGRADAYGEASFAEDLARIVTVTTGLGARRPVVELPARRHTGSISKPSAATILYRDVLSQAPADVIWTLVESDPDAKVMLDQLADEELAARKV